MRLWRGCCSEVLRCRPILLCAAHQPQSQPTAVRAACNSGPGNGCNRAVWQSTQNPAKPPGHYDPNRQTCHHMEPTGFQRGTQPVRLVSAFPFSCESCYLAHKVLPLCPPSLQVLTTRLYRGALPGSPPVDSGVSVLAVGGPASVTDVSVWPLQSCWEDAA